MRKKRKEKKPRASFYRRIGFVWATVSTSSKYYRTSDKPITCPAHCATKLKIPPIDRVIVIVGIRLSKRFSHDCKWLTSVHLFSAVRVISMHCSRLLLDGRSFIYIYMFVPSCYYFTACQFSCGSAAQTQLKGKTYRFRFVFSTSLTLITCITWRVLQQSYRYNFTISNGILSYTCDTTGKVLHILSHTCDTSGKVLHILSYTCDKLKW